MVFTLTLVPATPHSGILAAMHRQTRHFEAANKAAAEAAVKAAFPGGLDETGTWAVETVTERETTR